MRHSRSQIYKSEVHLIVTLALIIFPPIALLFVARVADLAATTMFETVIASIWRLTVAYFIAAGLGWVLATAFYRGRRAFVALPIFDVLQSFPTFAALPIAVMYFGRTNFTVIVFLVITIVWPIVFTMLSGLKLIRRDWEEAVTVTGLKGFKYLRYFLWPATIPALVTGSIIGIGNAWEAIVATEIIVGTPQGLGHFFQSLATEPLLTAFGIFALLAIIFSINNIIWLPLLEWSHSTFEE